MNLKNKSLQLIAGAAAALIIAGSSAASAATFDFVSIADGPDPNYIGSAELNWDDTAFAGGLTIDGITLIASGSHSSGIAADAFFDKGNAGLGVCSSFSCSSQVAGAITSDDNVTSGETLRLDFGEIVDITDIFFRNSGHPPLTGSLGLNGGILTVSGGLVTSGAHLLSGASIFDFSYTNSEFYIASATAVSVVPVPAGVALLLSGLGAFGAIGRRRKLTTT